MQGSDIREQRNMEHGTETGHHKKRSRDEEGREESRHDRGAGEQGSGRMGRRQMGGGGNIADTADVYASSGGGDREDREAVILSTNTG